VNQKVRGFLNWQPNKDGARLIMTIETCRQHIDNIDSKILNLLDRRAAVVREIAAIKLAAGLPIIDDDRELDMLTKAARMSYVGKRATSLRIYREIIRESREMQLEMQCELALSNETA